MYICGIVLCLVEETAEGSQSRCLLEPGVNSRTPVTSALYPTSSFYSQACQLNFPLKLGVRLAPVLKTIFHQCVIPV